LLEQYVRSLGYTSSSSAVSLFVYLGLRLMFVWFIYPKYGTYDVLMYHYAVAYVGIFLGQSILAVIAYYRHGKGKYKRL
jgi:Na+-driven multidrug efflux pump